MSDPRLTDLAKWRRKCAAIKRAVRKLNGKHSGILKGDVVKHLYHGTGKVLEEWGTWLSCRNCFRPFPQTGCCSGAGIFAVSGTNIFDVKFGDGKTYSINGRWLRKIEQPESVAA